MNKPTGLMPQRVEEIRTKGLCFICNKYNNEHKCNYNHLFYIYQEEEENPKLEQSQEV